MRASSRKLLLTTATAAALVAGLAGPVDASQTARAANGDATAAPGSSTNASSASQARDEGKKAVATGYGGAVASIDLDASRTGIETLKQGGNAIDAAVAMAATLGVTEPYVAGPGGGGFMVIYLAKQHQIITIDGRESCPAACTKSLFLDASGKPMEFELARHSGISVGVPGMVAQWDKAVTLYGKRSFADNLQPAIRTAERGFRVDEAFQYQTESSIDDLRAFTASRNLFLDKDGNPLPNGYLLRNPDLAKTYQKLAKYGPDYLYKGPLATAIARTVQHPPTAPDTTLTVLPGIMTRADLAGYAAKLRPPTHVEYRGLDVYGMAPPSSGGSTVGEALNILEGFDLNAKHEARGLHQYIEALHLAFADRNAYVGDTDQVNVPLQQLLSKTFADTRRCLIPDKASNAVAAPGNPRDLVPCGTTKSVPTQREGTSTNHLTTTDRWGNIVAYTNTIEQLGGSGITVPGYGFLLNNEMTDFTFAPATPGAYDPNLPAANKRPRSSMSPTIVMRNGKPFFTVGSPGGSTIITTVLQILLNRIDFGMTLPQAIAAPRVSQRNGTTSDAEPAFLSTWMARVLQDRYGQSLTEKTSFHPYGTTIGLASGLEFLPDGRVQAVAEPKRSSGGSAMVVHPAK